MLLLLLEGCRRRFHTYAKPTDFWATWLLERSSVCTIYIPIISLQHNKDPSALVVCERSMDLTTILKPRYIHTESASHHTNTQPPFRDSALYISPYMKPTLLSIKDPKTPSTSAPHTCSSSPDSSPKNAPTPHHRSERNRRCIALPVRPGSNIPGRKHKRQKLVMPAKKRNIMVSRNDNGGK